MEGGIAEAGIGEASFPEIDTSKQLNLGVPEEFPVDPISFELSTASSLQGEAEANVMAKEKAAAAKEDKWTSGTPLMSALIISGVVGVAIGAAFIISKKWKNT